MIDLYAVTDGGGPRLPDLAPLVEIRTRVLAAVCAPAEEHELTPDVLWRHEEVVEALMVDRDVLPFRYGMRMPDAAGTERLLEEKYDELFERLEFVRGASELSVRVLAGRGPEPHPVAAEKPASGTAYLRARAREVEVHADAARRVHAPLSETARASRTRPPALAGEMLRAAYLVDRERVESFVRLVAVLQEDHPQWRLTCTGPWPPYSFAQR